MPMDAQLWTEVETMAKERGLDPRLVTAIARNESQFSQAAKSNKGARGIMQMTPIALRELDRVGRNTGGYTWDQVVQDPRANTQAGLDYLQHLSEMYPGDVPKTLRAWNRGPTAENKGWPVPQETQEFQERVLRDYETASRVRPPTPSVAPAPGEMPHEVTDPAEAIELLRTVPAHMRELRSVPSTGGLYKEIGIPEKRWFWSGGPPGGVVAPSVGQYTAPGLPTSSVEEGEPIPGRKMGMAERGARGMWANTVGTIMGRFMRSFWHDLQNRPDAWAALPGLSEAMEGTTNPFERAVRAVEYTRNRAQREFERRGVDGGVDAMTDLLISSFLMEDLQMRTAPQGAYAKEMALEREAMGEALGRLITPHRYLSEDVQKTEEGQRILQAASKGLESEAWWTAAPTPPESFAEKALDTFTGLAGFVTQLALAKKVLAPRFMSPQMASVVGFGAMEELQGGKFGHGALLGATLQGMNRIPGMPMFARRPVTRFFTRHMGVPAMESGLFMGMESAANPEAGWEDYALQGMIPWGFRAVDRASWLKKRPAALKRAMERLERADGEPTLEDLTRDEWRAIYEFSEWESVKAAMSRSREVAYAGMKNGTPMVRDNRGRERPYKGFRDRFMEPKDQEAFIRDRYGEEVTQGTASVLQRLEMAMVRGTISESAYNMHRWLVENVDPDFDMTSRLDVVRGVGKTIGEKVVVGETAPEQTENMLRTAIRLYEGADAYTVLEEWAHRYWEHMSPEKRKGYEEWWSGVRGKEKDPERRDDVKEHFAKTAADAMMGRWVFTGRLGQVWNQFFRSPNDDMRSLLGNLLRLPSAMMRAHPSVRELWKEAYTRPAKGSPAPPSPKGEPSAQQRRYGRVPSIVRKMKRGVGITPQEIEEWSYQARVAGASEEDVAKGAEDLAWYNDIVRDGLPTRHERMMVNPREPRPPALDWVPQGRPRDKVHVKEAAVRIDGEVYTGKSHLAALRNAWEKRRSEKEFIDFLNEETERGDLLDSPIDGFVLSDGRFVSREEALRVVRETDPLYYPMMGELHAGDITKPSTQTRTPAFKRFFRQSKITDEKGEPLPMYHGSKNVFDAFNAKQRFEDVPLIFLTRDPKFAHEWMRGTGGIRERKVGERYMHQPGMEEARKKAKKDYWENLPTDEKGTPLGDPGEILANQPGKKDLPEGEWYTNIYKVYVRSEKPFDPRKDYKVIEPTLRAQPSMQGVLEQGMHKVGNWVVYENEHVVRKLKELGYDGLWLAESSEKGAPHDTLAVFDGKQIKSATGNIGTFDPMDPRITHQTRTPAFRNWFEGSQAKGKDGEPLPLYHSGSFDPEYDPVFETKRGAHFGTREAAETRPYGREQALAEESITVERDPDSGRWHWYNEHFRSGSFEMGKEEGFKTEKEARMDAERDVSDYEPDMSMLEETPITEVFLSIKNPKRVFDQGADWSDTIENAKKQGHDGLVYTNRVEDAGSESWVAFHPHQIKLTSNLEPTQRPEVNRQWRPRRGEERARDLFKGPRGDYPRLEPALGDPEVWVTDHEGNLLYGTAGSIVGGKDGMFVVEYPDGNRRSVPYEQIYVPPMGVKGGTTGLYRSTLDGVRAANGMPDLLDNGIMRALGAHPPASWNGRVPELVEEGARNAKGKSYELPLREAIEHPGLLERFGLDEPTKNKLEFVARALEGPMSPVGATELLQTPERLRPSAQARRRKRPGEDPWALHSGRMKKIGMHKVGMVIREVQKGKDMEALKRKYGLDDDQAKTIYNQALIERYAFDPAESPRYQRMPPGPLPPEHPHTLRTVPVRHHRTGRVRRLKNITPDAKGNLVRWVIARIGGRQFVVGKHILEERPGTGRLRGKTIYHEGEAKPLETGDLYTQGHFVGRGTTRDRSGTNKIRRLMARSEAYKHLAPDEQDAVLQKWVDEFLPGKDPEYLDQKDYLVLADKISDLRPVRGEIVNKEEFMTDEDGNVDITRPKKGKSGIPIEGDLYEAWENVIPTGGRDALKMTNALGKLGVPDPANRAGRMQQIVTGFQKPFYFFAGKGPAFHKQTQIAVRNAFGRAVKRWKKENADVRAASKRLKIKRKRLPLIAKHAIRMQEGGRGSAALEAMGIDPRTLEPLSKGEQAFLSMMMERLKQVGREINRMREANNMEPLELLNDYFTMMRIMENTESWIQPFSAETNEEFMRYVHRRQMRFPFAKERVHSDRPLELDPVSVFSRYMRYALEYLEVTPEVKRIRAYADYNPKDQSGEATDTGYKHRDPHGYSVMNKWLDHVAGKPTPEMTDSMRASIYRMLEGLSTRVGASILSMNFRSAMIQPSALRGTYTEVGPLDFFNGLLRWATDKDFRRMVSEESDVLEARVIEEGIDEIYRRWEMLRAGVGKGDARGLGKILRPIDMALVGGARVGLKPLMIIDKWTASISAAIGRHHIERKLQDPAFRRGLVEAGLIPEKATKEDLRIYAKDYVDNLVTATQASNTKDNQAPIQRHPLGRILLKFQSFVLNDFNYFVYDVMGARPGSLRPGDQGRSQISRMMHFALATSLISAMYEDLPEWLGLEETPLFQATFGTKFHSPFPRPIHRAADLAEAVDRGEMGLGRAAMRWLGEAVEPMPIVGGATRWGVTPLGPLAQVLNETAKLAAGAPGIKLPPWVIAGRFAGAPGISQALKMSRAGKKARKGRGKLGQSLTSRKYSLTGE